MIPTGKGSIVLYVSFILIVLILAWFLYIIYVFPTDYSIARLNAASLPGQIPKRIIQTGPANYSPRYKAPIKSVKTLNPDCEYMFFDDDDIDVFFQQLYPEYFVTYQRLPLLIQRLDFFRYVAIYHYGGVYLDLDMTALKTLDKDFFNHSCVFPVDEYLSSSMVRWPRYRPFLQDGCKFLLGQYAFAAEARHPFLFHLIQNIHGNIDSIVAEYGQRKNMRKRDREWFVYRTTGPDYVTQCYMNYWNKSQMYILDNGMRQHLGKYARHEYFGSWK